MFTAFTRSAAPRFVRTFRTTANYASKYEKGQTVEYKPIGGRNSETSKSTGKIERVITSSGTKAGSSPVSVDASPESPRYEVRNSKTGKLSPMKEENILRVITK